MAYDMKHPALWTLMMWVVAMLGIVGMLPVGGAVVHGECGGECME